jgi:exonuclease III
MNLSIFSWNVRGMVILGRKEVFREVLQKFKTKIVFLQEVKSFKFELHSCMGYVCNDSFWATYHVQGRGGVVLAILSYFYSFISTLGSDLRNCCMWIVILSQERL